MTTETTVVTTQPSRTINVAPVINIKYPRGQPREWSTQLCDCFDDCGGCMCGSFCFPCYQCHVAMKMGENCNVACCASGAGFAMRAAARERHNLQGSLLGDCCLSCWCAPCSLCQISRELDNIQAGNAEM